MGEAKSRLHRLLTKQPGCTYCGGTIAATSCDHCPPVAVFDGAFRPKGLEFSACDACHEGTRQIDLLAAMMSRLFPNPTTERQRADVRKHIKGFINNHADLATAFLDTTPVVDPRGKLGHVIDLQKQPRIHRAMRAFAARLGLALYREHVGEAAPAASSIVARWYSNMELEDDAEVEAFLKAFGAPRTLFMGKQQVADQFRYWGGVAADSPNLFGAFAAFRESFGVIAIINNTGDVPDGYDGDPATNRNAFSPGFLKGFRI